VICITDLKESPFFASVRDPGKSFSPVLPVQLGEVDDRNRHGVERGGWCCARLMEKGKSLVCKE